MLQQGQLLGNVEGIKEDEGHFRRLVCIDTFWQQLCVSGDKMYSSFLSAGIVQSVRCWTLGFWLRL